MCITRRPFASDYIWKNLEDCMKYHIKDQSRKCARRLGSQRLPKTDT